MFPTLLTTQQKDIYNDFVIKNNGSFLQSYEWGQWQEKIGQQVLRYVFKNNTGKIIMSSQIIKHKLPFGQYYLYCPYGPIFEQNLDDKSLLTQMENLVTKIFQDHKHATFLRIESTNPMISMPEKFNIKISDHIQPGNTIVNDLNQTLENILAAMHPKTRYNINLAKKHGVTIKVADNESEKQNASKMFQETLGRRKLAVQSTKYYLNLIKFFSNKNQKTALSVKIYEAVHQGKLIACALTVDFGNTRTYLFGGSAVEEKNLMAPYLLHWQIMQEAKADGKTIYDWYGKQGAVTTNTGIGRFKLGFGGKTIEYPNTQDIIQQQNNYRVYEILRKLNRFWKHL